MKPYVIIIAVMLFFTTITSAITIDSADTVIFVDDIIKKELQLYNFSEQTIFASLEGSLVENILLESITENKLSLTFIDPENITEGIYQPNIVIRDTTDTILLTQSLTLIKQFSKKEIFPQLEIFQAESEENIHFQLTTLNIGKADIKDIQASIAILDGTNNLIQTILTNSIALAPNEKGLLTASFRAPEQKTYQAIATISYDGSFKEEKANFEVGALNTEETLLTEEKTFFWYYVIALLILLNIIWLVYFKKKKQ